MEEKKPRKKRTYPTDPLFHIKESTCIWCGVQMFQMGSRCQSCFGTPGFNLCDKSPNSRHYPKTDEMVVDMVLKKYSEESPETLSSGEPYKEL